MGGRQHDTTFGPPASRPRRVATLKAAADFIDRAGLALVFPKPDVLLPSLWEAVVGSRPLGWEFEAEDGEVQLDQDMSKVWRWKDELAEKALACSGKHLLARASLISKKLLPSVYALTGRPGTPDDYEQETLSRLEREVATALLQAGPMTGPEMRRNIGAADTRRVNRAIDSLQKLWIVTRAGTKSQEHGWNAGVFDLLPRRYASWLRSLPADQDAEETIASAILFSAGELSPADLSGATRFRLRESQTILTRLADKKMASVSVEGGISIFKAGRTDRARS